jgi:type II secretory pathway pseudopilin PulG
MKEAHRGAPGFSLIEIAVVVVVVMLVAVMLAPLIAGLADVDRSSKTYADANRIYTAIVGTPTMGNFGYLGDVGQYPTTLMDLVRDNGLEGWNGPYLQEAVVENDAIYDSFGMPFEYFLSTNAGNVNDLMAVISKGPNRGSSNLSATPNSFSTYTGSPSPSLSNYKSNADNLDNVLFPPFTDNAGLLSYNGIGQLNLNILSYDFNSAAASKVDGYTPGCPNLYQIKLTSATRPSDTWGTATPGTTPTYAPGGASFDLIQGLYRLQISTATAYGGVAWEQSVSIVPGMAQNVTIPLAGVDSSTSPTETLNVTNFLTNNVSVNYFNAAGTATSTTATMGGGVSGPLTVRACSQVIVRNSTTNGIVDSFIMPANMASYAKVYRSAGTTWTVTNSSGAYRYLFVYINGVLIGEVSGWGKKKSKTFSNIKQSEVITVKDQTGVQRDSQTVGAGGGTSSL